MKFSITAASLAIISLVTALPQSPPPYGNYPWGSQICLTPTTAQSLVGGFASLLTAYSAATAEALLADDFTDTSSSINSLLGQDTNAVTFPSKAAFMAGQGSQPPIPFNVINIDVFNCDTISFRWNTTVTPIGATVKGINNLVASNKDNTAAGWQIKSVYR